MSSMIFSSVTALIFLMAILCGCSSNLNNPKVNKVDSSRSIVRTVDRVFSENTDSFGAFGKR